MKDKNLTTNKNKHITYDERIKIQECIALRYNKSKTALEINKSPSTVKREIENNRFLKASKVQIDNPYNCTYFKTCRVCTGKCKNYKEENCLSRDRYVGACNNCSKIRKCNLIHYLYDAQKAQKTYEETLVQSRQGVNLTKSELYKIAHIIVPLINKGHSPYTIIQNHPELNISVKTLYTYIAMGLFRDWGITNLSLKRKVKRKVKSNNLKKRNEPADYTGRKYEDYLEYLKNNPGIPTTEMDTVYNNQTGPYIQTFIFENTSLMIGILHKEKTTDSMSNTLNNMQDKLENDEYEKIFSLLLTDRGSEFAKPIQFEVNQDTGEIRSKIFYCDPQTPSQKPHIENNHILLRDILPNGQSWVNLSQESVDKIFSHINSLPRKSLGGKTPYDAFSFIYGENILKKLNIQKILKDEVNITPHLLK